MSTHSVHQFAEKVALITDGSQPIGKAVALQLALLGGFVVVGLPADAEIRDEIDELRSLGTLASSVRCDIKTGAGIDALLADVEARFGRIDLLVNCLKSRPESAFLEMSERDIDATNAANIKSALLVTQRAYRLMVDRPRARIVNVISALDTSETLGNAAFAASNSAVEGMTRSLAAVLPQNFRINAVAVSDAVDSSPNPDPELFQPRSKVSPDDAARAVLYLLSSEATSVNGQVIVLK